MKNGNDNLLYLCYNMYCLFANINRSSVMNFNTDIMFMLSCIRVIDILILNPNYAPSIHFIYINCHLTFTPFNNICSHLPCISPVKQFKYTIIYTIQHTRRFCMSCKRKGNPAYRWSDFFLVSLFCHFINSLFAKQAKKILFVTADTKTKQI